MKTKCARLSIFGCELILAFLLAGGLPAQQAPTAGSVQSQAVPHLVKFSSTVKDADGNPRTGVTGITFALYKDQVGGAALWLETQNVPLGAQGRYTVLLGAGSAEGVPLDAFTANEARWLGVQPEGLPEQRVLLVSVPYALKAADAETLGGRPASSFVLAAPSSGTGGTSQTGQNPALVAPTGPIPAAAITGSGTLNTVAKFDSTGTNIVDSTIFDNGLVGIGTTTPGAQLDVFVNTPAGQNALNSTVLLSNTSANNCPPTCILSAMNLQLWDSSQNTNFSKQPLRIAYLRQPNATGGVQVFDTVFTSSAFIHSNAPYQLRGMNVEGPNVDAGKTLDTFYGAYIGAPNAMGTTGTVTNNFALVTEPGAGNVGIGTTAPGSMLEVAGNLTVSGGGVITGNGSGLTNLNAGNLSSGTIPSSALSGVNGSGLTNVAAVTAAVATNALALNGKADTAFEQVTNKNAANGYAGLDSTSRISKAQAPGTTVFADASNSYTNGTQDFTQAARTLPVKAVLSSATPTSCFGGRELLIKTDATPGQQLFICNPGGNGWLLAGDGASGGVTSFNSRSGAVVPQNGDYSFSLLGGTATLAQLPTSVVNTSGSYADPAWLTSLSGSKIGGTVANASNAATVTNGVYTTGSYANPGWITSLAATKVSGAVAEATHAVNADAAATASTATNALALNGVAPNSYARRDVGNSFSGDQNVSGNATVSGNVGVGLTSPAEKVDIAGNLKLSGAVKFADGTSMQSALALVPSGFTIMGSSPTPPSGYTASGFTTVMNPLAWSTKAPMPNVQSCAAYGVVNGKLYLISGFNDASFVPGLRVQEYDPATDTWTSKKPALTARVCPAHAVVNNKIYVFGGYMAGGSPLATVEEYTPVTDTWVTKTQMPVPLGFTSAAAVGDKIYLFGGDTAGACCSPTNAVNEYDTVNDTWRAMDPMPISCRSRGAATFGNKVYVFGGTLPYNTENDEFDPAAPAGSQWKLKAPRPSTCEASPTVVYNNLFFTFGCWNSPVATAVVEMYVPGNNTWLTAPPVPRAAAAYAAGLINGLIYVTSGNTNTEFYTDTYQLDPSKVIMYLYTKN